MNKIPGVKYANIYPILTNPYLIKNHYAFLLNEYKIYFEIVVKYYNLEAQIKFPIVITCDQ